MCDTKLARSPADGTRPHWGALYLALGGNGLVWLAAEIAAPAGVWRVTARALFAALTISAMVVWVRHEASALDQADWCGCASSASAMRIISSRPWPARTPVISDERIAAAAVMAQADEANAELELAGVQ